MIPMVSAEILEGLSYNEKKLLLALESRGGAASPADLISGGSFALEVEIMGAASWLESKGMAGIKEQVEKFVTLEDESIVTEGLPERIAITKIDAKGGRIDMDELAAEMLTAREALVAWMLKICLSAEAAIDFSVPPTLSVSAESVSTLTQ